MIKIKQILCPIDFSDYSRRAVDHAFAIARCYGATVTALHVFSPAPVAAFGADGVVFEPIVLTPLDREQVLADTRTFVDAEKAPGVPIEAVVREGQAAGEIVDQAVTMDADLIVIGTHGRTGFERFLLGSVTEKVLRKARCPVLTVPRGLADAVPSGPVLYDRILCPVDFSDSSQHALRYAMSLAHEMGGQLTVLHVVAHEFENSADTAAIAYDTRTPVGDYLTAREDALRRRLDETVNSVAASGPVERLISHGKPWREILRIAQHADLIVMGVQGRGAADLFFFGSTTQHVVRAAPCPVLTLRS
jgi:nucleotide-binding universal stress UspA family protein